ncbi:MAG: hypothetical protein LBW85_06640 [Deltaproteobacteria bacterium]|jgi:hypothetical protein|nr:hypothetical protein [Deltaproteobacteria bacterium]
MPLTHLLTYGLNDCHPEFPGGVKAIGAYGLLHRLAADEISQEAADFLAEPAERPGEVTWHTQLAGEPVAFETLSGERREAALDALCGMAQSYARLALALRGSGTESGITAGLVMDRVAAAAAAAAVGASGPRLFLLDGRPVLAGWGLSTALGGSAREGWELTHTQSELMTGILSGHRPAIPPPPPAPAPAPAAGPQVQPEPPPPLPPPVQEAGPWQGALPWEQAPPKPRGPLPLLLAGLGALLLLLLLALGAYFYLWPSGAPPAASGPLPAAPAAAAPGADLVIPEDAKSFEFLAGCWLSGGGIVNTDTKLPVYYVYCFDQSGNAVVVIEEKTAAGEYKDTCDATARAFLEEGGLAIRTSPEGHRCQANPDVRYAATAVSCRPGEGGKAACVIEGSSDHPIDTAFTRLGDSYRPGTAGF